MQLIQDKNHKRENLQDYPTLVMSNADFRFLFTPSYPVCCCIAAATAIEVRAATQRCSTEAHNLFPSQLQRYFHTLSSYLYLYLSPPVTTVKWNNTNSSGYI